MKTNITLSKCCLCRNIVDDSRWICLNCVNTGRFCPSKHDTCSNKRRKTLENMLNANDLEEFRQYSNKYSINELAHLQYEFIEYFPYYFIIVYDRYSDRLFLLKKFNVEKIKLQNE